MLMNTVFVLGAELPGSVYNVRKFADTANQKCMHTNIDFWTFLGSFHFCVDFE